LFENNGNGLKTGTGKKNGKPFLPLLTNYGNELKTGTGKKWKTVSTVAYKRRKWAKNGNGKKVENRFYRCLQTTEIG
jgi:hypothetical protein